MMDQSESGAAWRCSPSYDGYDSIAKSAQEVREAHHEDGRTISMSAYDAILYQPRLDALLACDANLISYDPFSFSMVFGLRGRNFGMIIIPLLCLLVWDVCWALTLEWGYPSTPLVITKSLGGLISPLLTPVSFLLVFRLSRAAVRFWDSRAAFGKLVEICRDVASTAAVACKHNPELYDNFARWVCAFPIATKNFLRPHLSCAKDGRTRRIEIGPLLSYNDTNDLLTPVNGGGSMEFIAPIHCLDKLRELTYQLSFGEDDSNTLNNSPASTTSILQMQKGLHCIDN